MVLYFECDTRISKFVPSCTINEDSYLFLGALYVRVSRVVSPSINITNASFKKTKSLVDKGAWETLT